MRATCLARLSHNHQQLLAYGSGQFDFPLLHTSPPPRYIVGQQGQQYVAKFLYLFVGVLLGSASAESVEFLIVVIYNLRTDRSKQAVALTGYVHAATLLGIGVGARSIGGGRFL